MLEKIFLHPDVQQKPPVLIDIGASGNMHQIWKKIAKYSICIAFDADKRDFDMNAEHKSPFKKLYIYNSLVADKDEELANFYLTKSPHCSSLLFPNQEGLKETAWAERFEVEKIIQLKTTSLPKVLHELNINYIDWFKTDSQGIDLRLFKSLEEEIINHIKIAEFEPGILDCYVGEDKMSDVLAYMQARKDFWLVSLKIKGSQKIAQKNLEKIYKNKLLQKLAMFSLPKMAGWGEMTYCNEMLETKYFSKRDYLVAAAFAIVLKQFGFVLMLAEKAEKIFENENIFIELQKYAQKQIKNNIWKGKFWWAVKEKLKMIWNK
jgi:FkbM family methyltransferase